MLDVMELEQLGEDEGELLIADKTGHARLQWKRNKPDEVKRAKDRFDELKARGYMAYSVTGKGDQGEVVKDFDPKAERIIMNSQVIGG
jgi:hypothetical protein